MNPKKLQAFVEKEKAPPFARKKGRMPPEKDDEGGNPGKSKKKDDEDIDVDAIAKQIEDGDGDEELMDLVKDYDPEVDGNPAAWVADEDVWDRAKKAVDPEGEGAKYDQPWAVVAHVYEKMGGKRK
jgi:hypothetical protein